MSGIGPRREHLYLSTALWDGLWIVQQPICQEIQRGEPVLFVERFVSLPTVFRYPHLWRRLFSWLRGARRVTPNLRVLAPLPLFHLGHRFPRLFALEFSLQRRWINAWAGPPGRPRVLWIDNPLYQCGVRRFGESVVAYHVADEVTAFPASDAVILGRLEHQMLAKADVVFAAAGSLAEDKARCNANVHTIWNAIDATVFSGAGQVEPDEVDSIPAPRVAFVGVVDRWVDLELLAELARRMGDVHFVIVGPSRVPDGVMRRLPNVHFLGRRDRRAVPGILRRASASLVPFRLTPLTARILPLKIFEALAAGIIPISTPFSPDVQQLARAGQVLVGQSVQEWETLVRKAIAADAPDRRTELRQIGLRHTWAHRWAEMSEALEKLQRRASVENRRPL